MASLNYVQPKSSRNRFSLFLQLSAKKDSSQPGISSESYFASTPTTTTVDFMESCNPTSSILAGPKTLFRVNSGSSSPHLPRSPLRMDTSFFEEHIPPTTNELDAKEKARLLKKTRKLSKVFGEDIQRTTSRSLGKTPSHRRSISTHASDPEPSSRQQTTRKFSSQSDLASSSESGSRMEVSDWEAIPPVPSLPRESIDAFSGQGPAQHRIQPALYNLTHPKQSSDDVRALIPILSSSSRVSTDDIQKRRLTKPRPNIGEDKSKSASHPLKTRKSYDSLATTAVSPLDGTVLNKSLHRSRSLSTNRKKKLDEIDAAVEFDPQKFGRKQVSEGVHGV
ncbi:hypothetical protein J3R30DRAFT_1488649 [Lentinula aciculospora]|uniref:Uncharacterized protein n=1 Tax=Lentinula aciculospora TaxID=153920 RepID=A0A9W9DTR0_9AGAR|nr:hypothetical protein J3R30DRAFT_1488649 [Lentinula aciculospora]